MSVQQQRHQIMNSAMNAQTPAVSIRQQLLSRTYGTYETGALKETEPVLRIKYTISEDMTKGEQAQNKARFSAIADRPRILGSKRLSVLGFIHGRTGIEPYRNHGALLLKDRSSFSVPSRDVLQKSVTGDTNRPLKKKKGQRFFCTEFPPCQLSFTRSEHLTRHIQKHVGERPFQCHCSRRFSRLDNLRQHAQTVHINEDIPGDLLAGIGTRFQRQIRTDRVRPPNSRSRANTLGSQDGHSRGHSRNLSASGITSTTSSVSVSVTRPQDSRRRPPLAMANDGTARARVSLDTYNPPLMGSPGPSYQTYGNQSPSGITTPTSATFSAGTGSPRFPSGLQSPISTVPRSLPWGSRTPGRQLSVPSGANPFQGPQGSSTFPLPYISPLPSSTSSIFSQNNGLFASPTSSIFTESRRDSNAAEADWRHRTWHPGTYTSLGPRPATSGLSYYETPDALRPLSSLFQD